MDERNIIVGLDIGTTKVCTAVALMRKGPNPEIIGLGIQQNRGLKKGFVVDIEQTVASIRESLNEAKLMAGVNISKATIGITGGHIASFNSSGVVSVKGLEIDQQDIERVLDAAKAVVLPSDKKILHVIPQEFCVDNIRNINDPLGMCGVRLEANVYVVTGSVSLIQNIIKCVEKTDVSVDGVLLRSIASSHAVLSQEEKEMGVLLVDIGGGTTEIAVWKNSHLIHSQIIPVGGNHFTNDLAIVLKLPYNEAEKIKIHCGRIVKKNLSEDECLKIQKILGMRFRDINLDIIESILEARAEELFKIIRNIISKKSLENSIVGGIVLTGGGALMQDLSSLGEYIIEVPVRVGHPESFGGMTGIVKGPKFATVLGLLLESQEKHADRYDDFVPGKFNILSKLSRPFRYAFREIF